MSFQTRITNAPFYKQFYTPMWRMDTGTITHEDCDKFSDIMSSKDMHTGQQFTSYSDDPLNQRKAKVHFIEEPDDETRWMYNKLNTIITYYNDVYFNYEVTGYKYVQYTEYEPGGKHEFHMDLALEEQTNLFLLNENLRKISIVLLLNQPGKDFLGGEFQINHFSESYPETIPAQKGSVIMFPSFMLHRVAPIIAGKRKTLVSWVIGPKFR